METVNVIDPQIGGISKGVGMTAKQRRRAKVEARTQMVARPLIRAPQSDVAKIFEGYGDARKVAKPVIYRDRGGGAMTGLYAELKKARDGRNITLKMEYVQIQTSKGMRFHPNRDANVAKIQHYKSIHDSIVDKINKIKTDNFQARLDGGDTTAVPPKLEPHCNPFVRKGKKVVDAEDLDRFRVRKYATLRQDVDDDAAALATNRQVKHRTQRRDQARANKMAAALVGFSLIPSVKGDLGCDVVSHFWPDVFAMLFFLLLISYASSRIYSEYYVKIVVNLAMRLQGHSKTYSANDCTSLLDTWKLQSIGVTRGNLNSTLFWMVKLSFFFALTSRVSLYDASVFAVASVILGLVFGSVLRFVLLVGFFDRPPVITDVSGGTKFIGHKVQNKGTGGKSKLAKPPAAAIKATRSHPLPSRNALRSALVEEAVPSLRVSQVTKAQLMSGWVPRLIQRLPVRLPVDHDRIRAWLASLQSDGLPRPAGTTIGGPSAVRAVSPALSPVSDQSVLPNRPYPVLPRPSGVGGGAFSPIPGPPSPGVVNVPSGVGPGLGSGTLVGDSLVSEDDEEAVEPPFDVAKLPHTKTTWNSVELPEERHKFSVFDCLGSPYCGYVAIDLASCGVAEDKGFYDSFTSQFADVEDAGRPVNLAVFAKVRGVNLAVYSRSANGRRQLIFSRCHSTSFQWVFLEFLRGQMEYQDVMRAPYNKENYADIDDRDGALGHYYLIVPNISDDPLLKCASEMRYRLDWRWAFLLFVVFYASTRFTYFSLMATLTYICYRPWVGMRLVKRSYYKDNHDRRGVVDRRDKIKHQDSIATYKRALFIPILPLMSNHKLVVSWPFVEFDISDVLFNQVYISMLHLAASGKSPSMAVQELSRYREVNTDANDLDLLKNTYDLLNELSTRIPVTENSYDRSGLLAYNADNSKSIVAMTDAVRDNQVQGLGFNGNSILTYKLGRPKRGVPVAVAPIGVPCNKDGHLGPGMISLTDSHGVLAAFNSRAQTKVRNHDKHVRRDFELFSRTVIDWLITSSPLVVGEEPDCAVYYRSHNSGKKTVSQIDDTLAAYDRYRSGVMSPNELRKFERHSIFIKRESNIKIVGGVRKVKPRAIMTMSPLSSVECCPVVELIHAINNGRLSDNQVKNMTPLEAALKVAGWSDKSHMVTDYSAYESSIDVDLKAIENYALERLCEVNGFQNTRIHIRKLMGERVLVTKSGKLKIVTRCSGDYWTSFGNGILNVCLMKYQSHLKGMDWKLLEAVAEGDDGLMPTDIYDPVLLDKVGLVISDSQTGTRPGDCDFLRARFIGGRRYVNVGRALSIFWVKDGASLRRSKQLAILRSSALSLHHTAPGHPILFEIVNVIGKLTAGISDFKGSWRYKNRWTNKVEVGRLEDLSSFPRSVSVDETMRVEVSIGCSTLPGISINEQLTLEERIRKDGANFYFGRILEDYPDVDEKINTGLFDPVDNQDDFESLVSWYESTCDLVIARGENLGSY